MIAKIETIEIARLLHEVREAQPDDGDHEDAVELVLFLLREADKIKGRFADGSPFDE